MACDNPRELLHGYLDGELDLATNLELQRHLRECPVCAKSYEEQQSLRTAISTSHLAYKAPSDLKRRILTATRKAEAVGDAPRSFLWQRWLAVAASLVFAALILWNIDLTRNRRGPG